MTEAEREPHDLAVASEPPPEDAPGWRARARGLLDRGELREAATALRRALELDPDDAVARIDLAHVTHALGEHTEAIALLQEALRGSGDDADVLRSLADMQRMAGASRDALDTVGRLVDLRPDDVLAALDLAELHLELGDTDAAVTAFARLRELDEEPGHQVYALHGIVEAEANAGRWRRALDRAIDATAADRHRLTTDLLARAAVELFGPSEERPAPPWEDLRRELAAERSEHRRQHTDVADR